VAGSRHQHFGCGDAAQLQGHPGRLKLGGGEFSGGNVHVDGAGGDDADHVSVHQTLGESRVAQLLADRHLVPCLDEAGQIAFQGVSRHPGHGDTQVLSHAAGGEGYLQLLGGETCIVVKGLVEVAEAKEEDGVRVGLLDIQVLAAYRRHSPSTRYGLSKPFYRTGDQRVSHQNSARR